MKLCRMLYCAALLIAILIFDAEPESEAAR